MLRPALAMGLAAFVLSACGSGSEADPEQQPAAASKTPVTASTTAAPETSYFEEADGRTVNGPANATRSAATRALDRKRLIACNKLEAYPAWRRCWHGLLDPLSKNLTTLAGAWTAFEEQDLPRDCITATKKAARRTSSLAGEIDAVLSGIDSDKRREQVRALGSYNDTVTGVAEGYTKPFQDVTKVCYSPEDLASINASPSPSP